MPPDIAIIGAGLAGLTAACRLAAAGFAVTLYDKGRKPGGRLATRRGEKFTFNHGCQFFSARDPDFFDAMHEAGAQAWPAAGARRHAGVPDMAALAEFFAAGLRPRLETQIISIRSGVHGWELTLADGRTIRHGALILAIPAPQAEALLAPTGHDFSAALAPVHLAPCWAVMLGFTGAVDGPDITRFEAGPLAWIARENSRAGRAASPVCYTLHATPEWSTAHLEDDAATVTQALAAAFAAATGITAVPAYAAGHRWRYALADRPLGLPCLWDAEARLGLAGDWCLDGKLEAAYLSGKTLAETILGR